METSIFTSEYQMAWALYLLAALGCLWVWTFFTRWMWRYLREPLWVIAAVLLFTPTLAAPVGGDSSSAEYVPAVAMAAMDLLFKVNNDAWRALADMSFVAVAAFAAYLVLVLLRWMWCRFRARRAAEKKVTEVKQQPEPTLREIMSREQSAVAGDDGRV